MVHGGNELRQTLTLREDSQTNGGSDVTGTRFNRYNRGKRWEPDHGSVGIPEPGYELGSEYCP